MDQWTNVKVYPSVSNENWRYVCCMGKSEETTCCKKVTMMQVMTLTHMTRNLMQEKSFVLKNDMVSLRRCIWMHCPMIYIGVGIYGYFRSSKCDWTEQFSRACLVSLNRSLRLLRHMLRESHSIDKHVFHRYHKIRDDVKLGDIEVLQSTYRSQCGKICWLNLFHETRMHHIAIGVKLLPSCKLD